MSSDDGRLVETADEISTRFRVGARYIVTLAIPLESLRAGVVHLDVVWEPSPPHRLTAAELHDYRSGRDALFAEVAKLIGGNVAIVEV
jgi:hypothetical protein